MRSRNQADMSPDALRLENEYLRAEVRRLKQQRAPFASSTDAVSPLDAATTPLRLLIEKTEDLYVLFSPEGRILSYTGPQRFGLTSDDVQGLTPADIIQPELADEIFATLAEVVRTGRPATLEHSLEWRGENLTFVNNFMPVRDADGTVTAVLDVAVNRTDKARDAADLALAYDEISLQANMITAVFDALPDIVGVQLPDHTMLRYNKAGYDLLGLTPDEVLGRKCYELIGRTEPCEECATRQARATGRPAMVEKFVPELGVYLEARSVPVFDVNKQVSLFVEILRDISERKQTEEALEHSRVRYQDLFESASDAVFIHDRDGVILDANPRACEMTGRTHAELKGLHLAHLHTPQTREEGRRGLQRTLSDGGVRFESEMIRPDGQVVQVEIHARPLRSDPSLIQGVARDMTESKEAEKALKAGANWLRSLIEAMPVGYWAMDMDGRYTMQNAENRRHFGDIVGKRLQELDMPDYLKKEWAEQYRKAMAGETITVETSLQQGDKTRIFHGVVAPVLDGEAVVAIQGMFLDISDRKQMEERLRQAKIRAEQAVRAKGEFLANMSHEIRTPLNGVVTALHLAAESELVPEVKEYLDTAGHAADSLLTIIGDILDFSKLEAGKTDLQDTPFSLDTLIETTDAIFRKDVESKGLYLDWRRDPDVPRWLCGDMPRLRQILVNLLGNAVKFTDAGGVTVRIVPIERVEDVVTVAFTVTDTGVGVPKELMHRLFQPFTQADASFTRRYQGTGLGLSIVKRLVELMDGSVFLDSKEGGGATLQVQLPFRIAEDGGMSCGDQPEATAEIGHAGPVRPLRLLVVEDSPTNRLLVTRLLQKRGHSVAEAENGVAALEALSRERFDAVFMDVQMPELDGLEACRKLRNGECEARDPGVRVIAMTAHAGAGDREECLAAGMDDYIAKPISLYELDTVLRRTAGCS